MKSQVFNTEFGSGNISPYPNLTDVQKRQVIAGLFEQLMLFDKAVIRTNGQNHALILLIQVLGLKTVEKLLDLGYIDILIWTPVIVSGQGIKQDDGTIDESVIYTQPPIVAGSMHEDDMDPDNNILKALQVFGLTRERCRGFIRKARKRYVVPNGMEFSTGSADLVLNAYENGKLESLGFPYQKSPMDFNLDERQKIFSLSSTVLETAVLSDYGYKSFNNYEHFELGRQNFQRIGKAYQVTENAENLFQLKDIPALRTLFMNSQLEFDSLFKLRHKSNAKYFRNWLNSVSEYTDANDIAKEYIKQIEGKHKVTGTEDRLMKTISVTMTGAALGLAISNPLVGAAAGAGLSLLDEYWLSNLIKGKNPSMFIEDVKKKIE